MKSICSKFSDDVLKSCVRRFGTFIGGSHIMCADDIRHSVMSIRESLTCRMFVYDNHFYIAYDI